MTFPILGANSAIGGYAIDNSLRFNDDDSAYLNLSTSGSPTSSKKCTFSFWVKRGNLGIASEFFSAGSSEDRIGFSQASIGTDSVEFVFNNTGSGVFFASDNGSFIKFRDTSAWYHFVVAIDTTLATADDRLKFYQNGNLIPHDNAISGGSPVSGVPITQNYDLQFLTSGNNFSVGRNTDGSGSYLDGYLAEIHFIDGQQLAPTDFAEADEDSGIWKPVSYSGSYGNYGFYLDFENSGSLGADQSGNGNNFTPTNLASTDQTTDTPTNNFATMNPLAVTSAGTATFSEGNCQVATVVVGSMGGYCNINFPSSGKWYCEAKITTSSPSNAYIGVVEYSATDSNSFTNGDSTFYYGNGDKYVNGSTSSYGSAWSQNDIIGMAVNSDDNQITFYLNGVSQGVLSETIEGKTWNAGDTSGGVSHTFQWNFGNPVHSISSGNSDGNGYGNFEYEVPTGYLSLCSANLATELSPTIDDGSEYFQTKIYAGTGSAQSLTNDGNSNLQPDWIWFKNRSTTSANSLIDSTRGASVRLKSNDTDAESSASGNFVSFDTDGFSIEGSGSGYNTSSENFVAWQWKANGGTTSSNTDGSITSTVQTGGGGFSIVTYTGNGTAGATIGHSLGVSPSMIIVKSRTSADPWAVYHHQNTSAPETDVLFLNATDATLDNNTYWNDTAPTSSVFSVGTSGRVNRNTTTYVAYCFAEIEGYSKFGSYTGNGSTDGTFVYTGFRPAFVMMKETTDSATNWVIYDNKRGANTYNPVDLSLYPNLSNAEGDAGLDYDFVSNGFKVRTSNAGINASGDNYIYVAFAESPFVTSTSIPVCAR